MKIINSTGKDDLAIVHIAQAAGGNFVEFVESLHSPKPREEKWILTLSTLYGCPVSCTICDAGPYYLGRISKEGMFWQLDYMISRRYPAGEIPAKQLKVHFTRMGEPAFNLSVLDVINEFELYFNAPGFMPSISSIAPKGSEKFFEELLVLKTQKFSGGKFQLQFSIHTTNTLKRDELIPVRKWDLKQIAEYGKRFYRKGDRKITLSFAPSKENEIDTFDKNSVPKKRTSLGRFRHENISFVIAKDSRVVAYMGDDKEDECVYKFISSETFDLQNPSSNMDILDKGDLYAADFENNRWILLDIERNEKLRREFSSQAELLVNCDKATKAAGATPCNRCEDIEISPLDQSVYIAFTNNKPKNDYHGSIVRLIEKNNDHASSEFTWEVFASGGVDAGFSCPDNLNFDSKANIWVLSDMSTSSIRKGVYEQFKNNSLFMIPTSGSSKGKAFRFAAGPVDSEMCGTCFSPDESAMFMSVQHPGEGSGSINNPTSRWPDFGSEHPKPAVVAITGFK